MLRLVRFDTVPRDFDNFVIVSRFEACRLVLITSRRARWHGEFESIMKIRAVINQKGGVGKTTTSCNLGAALAERGDNVLVIDLDPQGNLSMHVGVDIFEVEKNVYDVLTGSATIEDVIVPTSQERLFCVPSNIDLSSAEVEMVSAVGRETILKDALLTYERSSGRRFDWVIIDCPPSLGLLCINALAAADEILIPMQAEFFALQGMSKLLEVVEIVRRRINSRLRIGGIVACRLDTRTNLTHEVLADIGRHFPELLFETSIRQNIKLAEAPSFGQTIFGYAPDSKGAEDYRALATEFLIGKPAPATSASGDEDVVAVESETKTKSEDSGATAIATETDRGKPDEVNDDHGKTDSVEIAEAASVSPTEVVPTPTPPDEAASSEKPTTIDETESTATTTTATVIPVAPKIDNIVMPPTSPSVPDVVATPSAPKLGPVTPENVAENIDRPVS